MTVARDESDEAPQPTAASEATATAASTSAVEASATSAVTTPRAGSWTGAVRPEVPATWRPPIQWPMVARVGLAHRYSLYSARAFSPRILSRVDAGRVAILASTDSSGSG